MATRALRTLRNRARGGSGRAARRLNRKGKTFKKAGIKAGQVLGKGIALGQELLPEVFEGGSGLGRTEFEDVTPDTLDFNGINKYLQPGVDDATARRAETTANYDELLGLRRAKLGGLDAAENQALKESLFRDIDRQNAGALRDVARTPGLGAGASFAQRRALGRDHADAGIGANRQLLLDNVNIKRQALGDFEGSLGARTDALTGADATLADLRGGQAQARANVDTFNLGNKISTDEFNRTGRLQADQFNQDSLKAELAARVGAVSTGTGIFGDERDRIAARKEKQKTLDFIAAQDAKRKEEAKGLFG